MNLTTVFWLTVGLLAMCQLILIPALKRRSVGLPSWRTIRAVALLSSVQYVRGVMIIAIATFSAFLIGYAIVQRLGGDSVEKVEQTMGFVRDVRDRLTSIGGAWSMVGFLLVLLGLGLLTYRKTLRDREEALRRGIGWEFERLRAHEAAGTLPKIEPTETMQEITRELEARKEFLRKLDGTNPNQRREIEAAIRKQIDELTEARKILDLQRRIDPKVEPWEAPVTAVQRIEAFFVSKGLLATLGRGSRLLFIAGYVLLLTTLIGIPSASVARSLDDRLAHLTELHVSLRNKENRLAVDAERTAIEEALALEEERLAEEVSIFDEDEDSGAAALIDDYVTLLEDSLALDDPILRIGSRLGSRAFRTTAVRDRILELGARHGRSAFRAAPSISSPGEHSGARRATVEFYNAELDRNGFVGRTPRTAEGERLADRLRRHLRRSPADVRSALRSAIASFQEPAGRRAFERALIGKIFGSVSGELPAPLDRIVGSVDAGAVADEYLKYRKAVTDRFITDLLSGGDPRNAIETLRSSEGRRLLLAATDATSVERMARRYVSAIPPPNEIARQYQRANAEAKPPTAVLNNAEPHRRADALAPMLDQRMDRVLRQVDLDGRLRAMTSDAQRRRFGEALASRFRLEAEMALVYDDLFPGQSGRPPTELARGMQRWGDNAARTARTVSRPAAVLANPMTQPSPRMAIRARSFVRLRGFARVGGVLIGREPLEQGSTIDIWDIRWEDTTDPDMIRLMLVPALSDDGVARPRSALVQREVVYHALLYAADGRPTTVTMITIDDMVGVALKILLHPTLIDSPLGHDLIALDRFVDIYTADAGEIPGSAAARRLDWNQRVRDQGALYQWAWTVRASTLAEHAPDLVDDFTRQHAAAILDNARIEAWAERAAARAGLRDPAESILVAKPQFFDNELVGWILDALDSSGDLTSVRSVVTRRSRLVAEPLGRTRAELLEIQEKVRRFRTLFDQLGLQRVLGDSAVAHNLALQKRLEEVAPRHNELLERTTLWLVSAPTFRTWSGVREAEYVLELDSLLPGEAIPLRFMDQVAFTSAPAFVGDTEGEEGWFDEDPWEFPSIAAALNDGVIEWIGNDPERQRVADVAAKFTVFQRLFRAAFEDRLGPSFPVERLFELAKVVAPPADAPADYTPRWNKGLVQHDALLGQALAITRELEELAARGEKGAGSGPSGDWRGRVVDAARAMRQVLDQRANEREAFRSSLANLVEAYSPGDDWEATWSAERQAQAAFLEWLVEQPFVALLHEGRLVLGDTDKDWMQFERYTAQFIRLREAFEWSDALGLDEDARALLERNRCGWRNPHPGVCWVLDDRVRHWFVVAIGQLTTRSRMGFAR